MRRSLATLVAVAVAVSLIGCGKSEPPPPPPSNDQQVATLVSELERTMVIDQVLKDGKLGNNAHWEKEAETKKRKVAVWNKKLRKSETKVVEVKSGSIVAEVTIVVDGNCKVQVEQLLITDSPYVAPTTYYFDETWLEDGTEVPITEESLFSFMPTRNTLEEYFSKGPRSREFAFCRGKPTQPSPPGRD